MNSLLKKRLPGILAAGLVALAVGAAGAPASAATAETSGGATISGLTKKQKKAKKKALKKCNKKKPAKKKKKCKKQVNKKYRKIAKKNDNKTPPIGKTWQVSVGDGGDFFAPSLLNLKVNDAINWSWANTTGKEPHNVTLVTGPSGVSRDAFASQLTSDPGYRFKRQFTVAGGYSFVCNIHVLMTMNVNVSN
jgi:plastocyanin